MTEHAFNIVVDGPDHVGKSTQLDLQEQRMINFGRRVMRYDEPGGTPMADLMRHAVLEGPDRHPKTEAMLYQTARVDKWYLEGEHALHNGIDLLASRNAEATKIYQGVAGGVDLQFLDDLNKLTMPPRYIHPDLFIVMVILDEAVLKQRREKAAAERGGLDVIESRPNSYRNKVYKAYIELAQRPDIKLVESSGTVEEVDEIMWGHIKKLLEEHS